MGWVAEEGWRGKLYESMGYFLGKWQAKEIGIPIDQESVTEEVE